jgi:RNA polymerase sigma-70 factor (ECF subfamily)
MTIQELEQCIALYGKDIYSFCRHLANDRDLADDLYQDTFLEALKKISDIRYRDNPKSYLLSIALRIWKNRVRKIAWRNRIAPTGSDDGLSEMLAGDGGEILGRLVEEEERRQQMPVAQIPYTQTEPMRSLRLLMRMEARCRTRQRMIFRCFVCRRSFMERASGM